MDRDYTVLLKNRLTPHFINGIVLLIKQYPEDMDTVYRLIYAPDTTVSWRAAWACEKLCAEFPEWFLDKRDELMEFSLGHPYEGTQRLILSILNKLPVTKPISIPFLNACFEGMFSPEEPAAIQTLYMKLSYRLCKEEPELLPELQMLLESINPEYYSTAVRTARKNMLLRINKTKKKCFQKN